MTKRYQCHFPEHGDTSEHAVTFDADSMKQAAEKAAAKWCWDHAEYVNKTVTVTDEAAASKTYDVVLCARPEFEAHEMNY